MSDDSEFLHLQPPFAATYSAADILAVNLAAWRYWAGLFAALAIAISLVPIILAVVDGYSWVDAFKAMDLSFTGLVLLILLAWILLASFAAFWWRRLRGWHGPISFALSPEGIRFRNTKMDGVLFWKAVRSINLSGDRIFFFLTRRSALVVPRRIFASGEQFTEFSAIVRNLWERERNR